METCTYPGCGYKAEFISKAHCRINHGIEREALIKKYGRPANNRNITLSNNPKKRQRPQSKVKLHDCYKIIETIEFNICIYLFIKAIIIQKTRSDYMKKFLIIGIIVSVIYGESYTKVKAEERFDFDGYENVLNIVTDSETGCKYIVSGSNFSGITPLLKADGTPECGK